MQSSNPPEDEDPSRHAAGVPVAIVGVDPLRVTGLLSAFEPEGELSFVVLTVRQLLDRKQVQLALIDKESSPGFLQLLATIRGVRPELRLIVLGADYEMDYIQRVIAAGARGYLAHTAPVADIRMAIEMVRDGSLWAPRKVLARLIDRTDSSGIAPAASSGGSPLYTPREVEVLQLLVSGRSNKEIAERLGLNEATVKAHVGRLFRKVGVNNRTALTMHAVRYSLLGKS